MYLQVQMPENGRKKIVSDKETTNKVLLMFSDIRVLRQR